MNDTAQIITAVATLCGVLGGLCLQAWSLVTSLDNRRVIGEVHAATNGMAKRLEGAAEAKGILQGRADEKAETAAAAPPKVAGL